MASAASTDIDDIDKAIVRALQSDGRLAYSHLGSMVGLSEAAARQRVHRLTERRVIQIVAVADPAKIGLPIQAMIGINVDGDTGVVAEQLASVEQFEYVVIAAGRYDILAEVVCSDTDDLLRVVNEHVRSIPTVRATEILTYLKLVKESYDFGTG